MTRTVHFELNGQAVVLDAIDPCTPLLELLRARGWLAAKEGCAEGECGTCAVVIRDEAADGSSRFEAVQSCLVPAGCMHGRQCWTVEGLGTEQALHAVQSALLAQRASQCGYCTPGFVASLFAYQYRSPRPDPVHALSGNLCRCTGYVPILAAARSLPQVAAADHFAAVLAAAPAAPDALHIESAGISFDRPTSLGDALALRARHPGAQLLAGGTDLLVEWMDGRPSTHIIALDALAELRRGSIEHERVVLGAGLTFADLEAIPLAGAPLWRELLPLFGSRQIRARATLGGNLVTASPVGDAAPVLLALDAEVELRSLNGARWLPIAELFTAYRRTALAADELLISVRYPNTPAAQARFFKAQRRAQDDIACVSLAAVLVRDEGGLVTRAWLAFGGVAGTPIRATAAEAALEGTRFDGESLQRAQRLLLQELTPIDDTRGSADYRRALMTGLLAKFQHEAAP